MTSRTTILFKFSVAKTFEALSFPSGSARLFDVKKAIVMAKRLNTFSIEFDLSVKDANTNEEYVDESMLLSHGTRIIVERFPPATTGQGFLARMGRNQLRVPDSEGTCGPQRSAHAVGLNSKSDGCCGDKIRGKNSGARQSIINNPENQELFALRKVTNTQFSLDSPIISGKDRLDCKRKRRPDRIADPELREQHNQTLPKKRRGIPQSFRSLLAQRSADSVNGAMNASINFPGFKDLLNRSGGQSENTIKSAQRELKHAMEITGTSLPRYLQCAICHGVVREAVLLTWDEKGRTACEACIRSALIKNDFRCPLTGFDGISQDDIHTYHAIRREAEKFVKDVMEKMKEIEHQKIPSDEGEAKTGVPLRDDNIISPIQACTFDGKRKGSATVSVVNDDDFGGDVFAVIEA